MCETCKNLLQLLEKREEQAIIFRLRTATGMGLMNCRQAYRDHNRDFEAAKKYLLRQPSPGKILY